MISRDEQYALAQRTALISGALAVVVAAILLADYGTRVAEDPLNTPAYTALKDQLRAEPQNETLQQSLRTLDRQLREAYFNRRQMARWGAWLLLGSAVLCLASAKAAATLRRRLPNPQAVPSREDPEERERMASRWSVAGLAAAAAVLAVSLYVGLPNSLEEPAPSARLTLAGSRGAFEAAAVPGTTTGTGSGADAATGAVAGTGSGADAAANAAAASDSGVDFSAGSPATSGAESASGTSPAVSAPPVVPETAAGDLPELPAGFPRDEELQQNWPIFRGPGGLGIAAGAVVPLRWDGESGEGILWKTAVPLPGNNSPIVWNDRVFLTGAEEQTCEVYCFAAAGGELLWRTVLPRTPETPDEVPEVMEATGLAASTAATDGRRVYAIFANGELAALDFDGNVRWQRSLGLPKNSYGHASSLAIHQDLLLVQFDQGTRNDGLSRLLALRTGTGETAWEVVREVPNSWPSPIVIHVGGQPQIITCADPWVIAYAPADGTEIWRVKYLHGDVGPSPTFAGGLVFAANEFPGLAAIRADGSGDVSDSHVAWEVDLGAPDCCSPLATDEFVFLAASYGILTCYDAREGGDPLWEQEFDASFVSSPVLLGEYILLLDEKGQAWLVQPSRDECRVVAENSLGEECVTTPAYHQGRMYIRGKEHLFCIAAPAES